jgi:histone H3/H4
MRVRSWRHLLVRTGFLAALVFAPSVVVADASGKEGPPRAPADGEAITPPFITFQQVINQNLIVQASLCVGLDCVSSENFGFDTLRLKENNLRIHFEDTSTAGGYPSNDWAIQANATQPGGGNYLAVLDLNTNNMTFRIDAGAPVDSLRVANSGNIGLGTSLPQLDVHMTSGNTPAIRFEQTNAAGFGPYTWDVGGNETNFFVRDLSAGVRMPFKILPGVTSNAVVIATAGVGIGTNTPSAALHVASGSAQIDGAVNVTSIGAAPPQPASGANLFYTTRLNVQLPDGQQPLKVRPGGFSGGGGVDVDGVLRFDHGTGVPATPTGTIYVWHELSDSTLKFRLPGGTTTAYLSNTGIWTDGSSRAFKRDIRPLDLRDAAAAVRALEPVRYYGNNSTEEQLGFIAEDVPDLVASAGRKGIAPIDIVAALTKVVQDQQTKIDTMAAEMAALKAAIEELRKAPK